MAPLVVGISGPTRSGKGTLSKGLVRKLLGDWYWGEKMVHGPKRVTSFRSGQMVSCICQDDFFLQGSHVKSELAGNWENPDAVNHPAALYLVSLQVIFEFVLLVLL
ncbi:unnamed protein product [Polarella glacialis]|uniref:Uncharacterized protein n=1 Tax=Polarella glacialis TaxID=89957 RepID=A0A813GF62_POLGL|nr:unnamed protein product [Polarella glacialis]